MHLLHAILVLGLFSLSASAQKERCISVGINPFAPLGLTNLPRYEVYGEYFFARSSLAVDLGKPLTTPRNYPDSSELKRNGFRSAISYKYFLGKKKTFALGEQPQDCFYIGVNLFYWQRSSQTESAISIRLRIVTQTHTKQDATLPGSA